MSEDCVGPTWAVWAGGVSVFLVGFVAGCTLIRLWTRLTFRIRKADLSSCELNGFLHRTESNKTDESKDDDKLEIKSLSTYRTYVKQNEYEIDAKYLHLYEVLGEGAVGTVLRGTFSPPDWPYLSQVAVKRVRASSSLEQNGLSNLLNEAKILKSLGEKGSHENITRFIGLGHEAQTDSSFEHASSLFLVFELCEQGSLRDYLHRVQLTTPVPAPVPVVRQYVRVKTLKTESLNMNLLQWTAQIADGLQFLHSNNVIHRDIALRNILLSSQNLAKISDFGMARQLFSSEQKIYVLTGMVPWKWAAPEVLETFSGPFTPRSDVWAFGVLFWEIFSLGATPYGEVDMLEPYELSQRLNVGFRAQRPQYASREIYELMLACWNAHPSERPPMLELKEQLQCLRASTSATDGPHYVIT